MEGYDVKRGHEEIIKQYTHSLGGMADIELLKEIATLLMLINYRLDTVMTRIDDIG